MSKNAGKLVPGVTNGSGKRAIVLPYMARAQEPHLEENPENRPVSQVDFAELSDGSLVEMIEDPEDSAKTLLAVYTNRSVRYTDRIGDRGRTLVPVSQGHENLQWVRLAQGAEPYGRIQDLEREVGRILKACLELESGSLILMTAFIISTWLQEKAPVAPYLALVGPPGSGKTTALRVLHSLCYRSVLTTDISSSAFYEISHRIRPTILIDETLTAGRSRELIHLLKASSTPDAVSLRKDKARLAYGPKVFAWLELPNDAALNSRCLILPMHRTSDGNLKRPNDPRLSEWASTMRKQLLQFRFERFKSTAIPQVPSEPALSARPLDLYQALALPFVQHRRMCLRLAQLVVQQRQHQSQILSPMQASVLRVLYVAIHERLRSFNVPMKQLTAAVNDDLSNRGEGHKINERKLGDLLTSLSLTNRTRMNTGYVLYLSRSDRVRIHLSFRDYLVEEISRKPIKKCELCRQKAT